MSKEEENIFFKKFKKRQKRGQYQALYSLLVTSLDAIVLSVVMSGTLFRGEQQASSSGLLLLTNAQRNQQGVYQCNARNSLGVNVTQQLAVTVERE